jgi:hypothetical protein
MMSPIIPHTSQSFSARERSVYGSHLNLYNDQNDRLLQEGLEVIIGPAMKIFRACIALGYIPLSWSVGAVVSVPGDRKVTQPILK